MDHESVTITLSMSNPLNKNIGRIYEPQEWPGLEDNQANVSGFWAYIAYKYSVIFWLIYFLPKLNFIFIASNKIRFRHDVDIYVNGVKLNDDDRLDFIISEFHHIQIFDQPKGIIGDILEPFSPRLCNALPSIIKPMWAGFEPI